MTMIIIDRSVLVQALEVLECDGLLKKRQAITALRAALAQKQAEPVVGWMDPESEDVVSAAQRAVWAQDFGVAGRRKAGRFTIPLRACLAQEQAEPEGSVCARCGALAFDPVVPQAEPLNLSDRAVQKRLAAQWGYVPAEQAEPDHETRAELAEQQVVQLAEERDHYRNLWQKAQQAESPCACWPGRLCSRQAQCAADVVRKQQAESKPLEPDIAKIVSDNLGKLYVEDPVEPVQKFKPTPLTQEQMDAPLKAEPAQAEPVAWMGAYDKTELYYRKPPQADVVPLYAAPPKAEPAQEPVAVVRWNDIGHISWRALVMLPDGTPLYTAPPRRAMVPLTEREIGKLTAMFDARHSVRVGIARAIEKASWEKNHG